MVGDPKTDCCGGDAGDPNVLFEKGLLPNTEVWFALFPTPNALFVDCAACPNKLEGCDAVPKTWSNLRNIQT